MFNIKIISILTIFVFLFVGCEEATKVEDSNSASSARKKNTFNDPNLGNETGYVHDYFFDFDEEIPIEKIRTNLGSGTSSVDERLDCLRIDDNRHDLELLIWPNGRCIALNARHPNMVAMAAVHWKAKFADKKSLKA